ncbi:glycosyltransferase family 2 protein [Actinoplanes sp. Pm04-4]|uniref:Glycosyltransferase family 2 protein n=1 Tax=Paractinoplanes pyxinae TaxID=2997416 RepID=A0ABT4BCS3_9ACTN|nr:glycosyltransferase family 2 protein [Actinoplanes pyxinae]MCY1144324.1 glycosyltransferase family 2 protein [Actinoplanes pyxinae]
MNRSAVIIPARDEVRSIAGVIDDVLNTIRPDLVVVVDDRSCDSTADEARRAGALVVSTDSDHTGLGSAMNLGVRTGRRAGCDTFLTIDADGQYRAADLLRLWNFQRVGGFDMVVGDRLADGRPESMRRVRYSANQVFSTVFSAALDLEQRTDSQSGMRVFNSAVADTCAVTNSFTYTQEQLLRARIQGLRTATTPVSFERRVHGRSRLVRSTLDYAYRTVPHLIRVYLEHAGGNAHQARGRLLDQLATLDAPSLTSTAAAASLADHSGWASPGKAAGLPDFSRQ